MGWYIEPDTLSIAKLGGIVKYNEELRKRINDCKKIINISCGLCNYDCKKCGSNNSS